MIKSSLIKWAVAAALAVPAVPMFGRTVHHRLVHRSHAHIVLAAKPSTASRTTGRKHPLVTRSHRKVTLASRHSLISSHGVASHRLTSTHRTVHKAASTTHRHAKLSSTSTSHFKVHVTKMPPTIDGLST